MPDRVRYEVGDGIATITIDDPGRRNALSREVRDGLSAAFANFEDDDTARVAVLTGAGDRAFCAGGDLRDMTATGLAKVPRDYIPLPGRNMTVDKPWMVAVNGVAAGGGVLYTALADLAVAAENARFVMPEAALGRGAPWSVPMSSQVSRKVWFEMAVTGEPVDAQRAQAIGLLNDVVPGDRLMARAYELAAKIVAAAPLTVDATLRMVRGAGDMGETAAWDAADRIFKDVYASDDGLEGPRAWIEKRPPQWRGR